MDESVPSCSGHLLGPRSRSAHLSGRAANMGCRGHPFSRYRSCVPVTSAKYAHLTKLSRGIRPPAESTPTTPVAPRPAAISHRGSRRTLRGRVFKDGGTRRGQAESPSPAKMPSFQPRTGGKTWFTRSVLWRGSPTPQSAGAAQGAEIHPASCGQSLLPRGPLSPTGATPHEGSAPDQGQEGVKRELGW